MNDFEIALETVHQKAYQLMKKSKRDLKAEKLNPTQR